MDPPKKYKIPQQRHTEARSLIPAEPITPPTASKLNQSRSKHPWKSTVRNPYNRIRYRKRGIPRLDPRIRNPPSHRARHEDAGAGDRRRGSRRRRKRRRRKSMRTRRSRSEAREVCCFLDRHQVSSSKPSDHLAA